MCNYENGKIYKISDKNNTKCYYGSTTRELVMRFMEHKYSKDNNSIKIIFNEFGVENCKIELVLEFPCDSRKDLEKKEGEYIKNNECVNINIVGRTIKEQKKQYYNDNKQKIKEYCIINKEKIKEYRNINKSKMKHYYEINKEQKKEYQKQYNLDNKDKIKEYQKQYNLDNKDKIKEQKKQYCENKKK